MQKLLLATAMAMLLSPMGARAATVVLEFGTNEMACTGSDGGAVDRACTTNGQYIGANYGSTTGLTVGYDASEASGSQTSLLFSTSNGGRAYAFPVGPADEPSLIFFTPDAGYEVSFSSFTWSAGSATSTALFFFQVVDQGGTVLFDAGNSVATYAVNTAYASGPLTFKFGNGGQGGVDIDRIVLDLRPTAVGGVPEPGTWALMILGFGAAGCVARRRRLAPMA
ncbi:MAG: PEP-CTERM sorting domain-containing protein [Phenylobacterium sp.]|uniref:PEPxxWA-CTERM sorting domain-containing protein n=1 Tax=Phenylobacterium sp. TaxID=1871053 RepID=UPI0025ED1260|nr:PEPxxWA-CTERM sorting domain-containing protein [Phenylobacterium sp.]MBI1199083.1 PEP-CTERM sorting domain-containing protein [Phenylobacterium sp.]